MLDPEREAFGDSYHDSGKLICHPDGRPAHPDTITDRFNRRVNRARVMRIRLDAPVDREGPDRGRRGRRVLLGSGWSAPGAGLPISAPRRRATGARKCADDE